MSSNISNEIGFDDRDLLQMLDFVQSGRELWPHISNVMAFMSRQLVVKRFVDLERSQVFCGDSEQKMKIFQYWDEDIPPNDVSVMMEKWKQSVPDDKYELFSDKSARKFLMENYASNYVAAYDKCHHPAMKSDYFRYAYLYKNGGIYIDADEEMVRAIPPLNLMDMDALITYSMSFVLEIQNEIGSEDKKEVTKTATTRQFGLQNILRNNDPSSGEVVVYFNNAMIITSPGNPIIKNSLIRATKYILYPSLNKLDGDVHYTTGPDCLTSCIISEILLRAMACRVGPEVFVVDWDQYAQSRHCEYKDSNRNWRRRSPV